jgi:hypothetical protein
MFSMWENVSGAIMFVRDHGRVIPSPAQAESGFESGTQESGSGRGFRQPSIPMPM